MDCSLPGSSVHGISWARALEWVTWKLLFPPPGESTWPKDWICISWNGRQILYHWATREGPSLAKSYIFNPCRKIHEESSHTCGQIKPAPYMMLLMEEGRTSVGLGVPGCGEHLGNWLLARLVSPLLTPPLLLLITSIFLLPLLYVTLWAFLGVPDYGEHIGNWLLARLLSPFDSPSPPGHLYLPPPSSLLHVTVRTSLGGPHCGESFHC